MPLGGGRQVRWQACCLRRRSGWACPGQPLRCVAATIIKWRREAPIFVGCHRSTTRRGFSNCIDGTHAQCNTLRHRHQSVATADRSPAWLRSQPMVSASADAFVPRLRPSGLRGITFALLFPAIVVLPISRLEPSPCARCTTPGKWFAEHGRFVLAANRPARRCQAMPN